MENLKELHQKLQKQCPSDYRINEIIPFAYPYRRLKIRAMVNKHPEKSIQQVYSVFLRSVQAGYGRQEELVDFLGLKKEDFILEELYFLRKKGFLDFAAGEWLITEQGEKYIEDSSLLTVLEEEDFEFFIDGLNGKILKKDFRTYKAPKGKSNHLNLLKREMDFSHKSPELLKDKNSELADVYKQQSQGKAYLIDYDPTKISYDNKEIAEYYLIEYLPVSSKEKELEPYIEVRQQNKEFTLDKRITEILFKRYPEVVYDFTDSERRVLVELAKEEEFEVLDNLVTDTNQQLNQQLGVQTLSIWKTKDEFVKALKTAQKKVLIESPWIKRVALEYIPWIEKGLKKGVVFVILYGIGENDEHHRRAEKAMEKLAEEYQGMALVHLPSHFENLNNGMTGTHRKLMIKDEEFFIQGSFNFLSFGKKEGQMVANEESILIREKVAEKWESVFKEYKLPKRFMKGRK